ncbi:MAG: sigma factor-like helix-turn-helix DNA-binding protein [Acidobacteriota bacterium]
MAQPVFDLSRHTRHQLFEAILQTLNDMPEQQRKVFVMSHYQGKPSREIARTLGLEEAKIPQLLHEADLKFFRGVGRQRLDRGISGQSAFVAPR